MSSRTAGLLVASTATFLFGLSAVASGCSEETTSAPGPDAEVVQAIDAASQKDAPPPPEAGPIPSLATCLAECGTKYPSGKKKDDAITTCWKTKCAGICTDDAVDAGDSDAGDGGTCQNPVTTEDIACDRCTQTHCCAEWDGCFNDDECTDFVQCTVACPAE